MVEADNREVAGAALEQVCAHGDMALAPQCYAEDFVDHVGRMQFRGLDGVRRSTEARVQLSSEHDCRRGPVSG
jgi:hypothetical protein